MKIMNNHKGPLGLPDGTVLQPGVAETVANWEQLKKNTVVQGWVNAKILTINGSASPPAPPAPSLLGSNLLASNIELVGDVTVPLGDVVRHAHSASGLSIEDWNALDDMLREAKLADAVEQLRSEAIAAAEAKSSKAADDAAAAVADAADDKPALAAKAKALGVAGAGTHWGADKLKAAIAAAEAKKSEG